MCNLQPEVVETLDTTVDAPSAARAVVARAAEHAHISGWQRETAVLLTSETVTNVVQHTTSPTLTLSITCDGSELTVSVFDGDASPPQVGEPAAVDETGRGLMIVRELASAWGVEPEAEGKRVWFSAS